MQRESDVLLRTLPNHCIEEGYAGVTGAGALSAMYVVHTVGPVYSKSLHDQCVNALESAVYQALLAAHERGCRSVAIPAISSGIFGFPKVSQLR